MSTWMVNDSDRRSLSALANGKVPVMRVRSPDDPHHAAEKTVLDRYPPWITAVEPSPPPTSWKRKKNKNKRKGKGTANGNAKRGAAAKTEL